MREKKVNEDTDVQLRYNHGILEEVNKNTDVSDNIPT